MVMEPKDYAAVIEHPLLIIWEYDWMPRIHVYIYRFICRYIYIYLFLPIYLYIYIYAVDRLVSRRISSPNCLTLAGWIQLHLFWWWTKGLQGTRVWIFTSAMCVLANVVVVFLLASSVGFFFFRSGPFWECWHIYIYIYIPGKPLESPIFKAIVAGFRGKVA